jgi:methionine synthase / methylenetetrahydrofolate reductase(NADPH)
MHPFVKRIKEGPLLGDGAMGTYLYAKGVSFSRCFDELNLTSPQLVGQVHDDYIAAGSELIETNTFGANRLRLAPHGLDGQVREINMKAARIARDRREVAGRDIYVAGSVGPVGKRVGHHGGVTVIEARAAFKEQAEALLEGGIDVFMIETVADIEEMRIAVEEIRNLCDLPIVAQLTINDDLTTITGHTPIDLMELAREYNLEVIGANCSVGPQRLYDFVAILRALSNAVLSAQPNAGLPRYYDGRFFYGSTPDYFADYCRKFLNLGVSLIGGCCGTTPDHIRAMRKVFDSFSTVGVEPSIVEVPQLERKPRQELPTARVSNFAAKLGSKFVVSVEIDPPRGANPEKLLNAAVKLRDSGVDSVNVADSPMARVRMSCLAMAGLISERVGLDVILHFTCRDRNLMGLHSDLIGAHALGIRNILALTGDPPSLGDYPNATAVYDVDAIGLVEIISRLNNGTDLAGNSLGSHTDFSIGVAINPTAENLETELERLKLKIAAGAQFAMTQPMYKLDVLERFLIKANEFQIPTLLGLLPLQSYRHAEFLHNEVPGIDIPQEIRDRLNRAGKDAASVGIENCRDLLHAAKHLVQGAYLMPSFGRYETILQVLE